MDEVTGALKYALNLLSWAKKKDFPLRAQFGAGPAGIRVILNVASFVLAIN
jgi:hypothetical protein